MAYTPRDGQFRAVLIGDNLRTYFHSRESAEFYLEQFGNVLREVGGATNLVIKDLKED